MDQAARRSQTSKGGPRVLTVTPLIINQSVINGLASNCPTCALSTGVVTQNEDFEEGRDLLVHGWYVLETDISLFWQQVNPADACTTNPLRTGRKLAAGQCVAFFVDQSIIDGVIVFYFCEQEQPVYCSVEEEIREDQGFVRISRADTVLKMSVTGDNATDMVPQPSSACTE